MSNKAMVIELESGDILKITMEYEYNDINILSNGRAIGCICTDGSCMLFPDPQLDKLTVSV